MHNKNTIMGKKQPWEFEKRIAEGDAGVVYIVRGLHTGEKAILKHPAYNPIYADRQARQIKLEGEILRKINGIEVALENWGINVRAVNLIDINSSDDYFIVLEYISGFDLEILLSIWREIKISQRANPFLDNFIYIKKFFNLLLLVSFYGVAQYLKTIHYLGPNQNRGDVGVFWADLRPQHIFWDFKAWEIILIDWGNSEFLYEDRDQNRFSEWEMFIDEFQRFYKMFEPDDFIALGFPDAIGDPATNEQVVEEFLSQIEGNIQGLIDEINQLPSFENFDDLSRLFEEFNIFFNEEKFRKIFFKCCENKMPFFHAGIIAALLSKKEFQLLDKYGKHLHEIMSSSSEVKTLQILGLYEQIPPYLLKLLYPSISFSPSEQSWIAENLHQYLTDSNFINTFTKLHDRGIPLIQAAETAAVLVDRHYSQSEKTIELNLARPNSFRWIIAFHRMGLLEKYLEHTEFEKYPSDIRRKAEEIIFFVGKIKHLLDRQDINESGLLNTIEKCCEDMRVFHAGTLAFILYGGSFTWTEFIIRWSQEILINEDEKNALENMDLYKGFISKIQNQYTSRVEPLDEKIEAIHVHFGHALLDEDFISILRECVNGRLSLWDSVLISAVVTSNTRNLNKDQIASLKKILESNNTLEFLKRLGLHNSFTEKLRKLGIFPEPVIKAPNPIPKPILPDSAPNPFPRRDIPSPHAPNPIPEAAPMPRIGRILGLALTMFLLILIICSTSLFIAASNSQPDAVSSQPIVLSPFWQGFITLVKGVVVAMLFTVVPFWAAIITRYKSRISQSITEVFTFSVVLSIVALFMFKLQGDGTWMLFAIAIAAVLDGGGHLLDYLRGNQIAQIKREINGKQKMLGTKMKSSRKAIRLEKEINQYQVIQDYLLLFDQIFQRERILYVSLPVGILFGVMFGVYKGATVYEYLEYSILFVSLFATLILGYFVVELFARMVNPVYAGEYNPDDLMVFNSSDLEKSREEKESALGFAKTTTEIRSMYLYDSAHNIFLLVSFGYIFFSSIDHVLPLKWVVFIALMSLILLNQVPFAVGQAFLREYILRKYGSSARGYMEGELKKDEFAPLMIKPEFLTSVFTIGAGGLLIALAENFIKELFK